jgi:alcohol dehydrogenase class IV
LDVARAIALRINHRQDLFIYDDLIGGDVHVTNDVPHFITIPTTAGTGSEVDEALSFRMMKHIRKKFFFLRSSWRK